MSRRRAVQLVLTLAAFVLAPAAVFAADYTEKKTGLVFPAKLGQFTGGEPQEFDQPGAGVVIQYRLPDSGRLDVYVYDLQLTGIGNGLTSGKAKAEFEGVLGAIQELQRRGLYTSVSTPTATEEVVKTPGGDLKILHGYVTFKQKAADGSLSPLLHSHTYLTGYKGQFFKVRLTYPDGARAKGDAARNELLTEFGKILK